MPRQARARAYRHGNGWLAAWVDETGVRQRKGAASAPSGEALAHGDERLEEVSALRRGDRLPASHRPATVDEKLLDVFLEKKGATVSSLTAKKMLRELRRAREAAFGNRHPDSLSRLEIEDWRATLAPGSRHNAFRSFRQAFTWAHQRGLTEREPSAGIRNPKRKRHERKPIIPFETWAEVDAIAGEETGELYRAIPVFAVGTGLPARGVDRARAHQRRRPRGAAHPRLQALHRRADRAGHEDGAGTVRAAPGSRARGARRRPSADRHSDPLPCSAWRLSGDQPLPAAARRYPALRAAGARAARHVHDAAHRSRRGRSRKARSAAAGRRDHGHLDPSVSSRTRITAGSAGPTSGSWRRSTPTTRRRLQRMARCPDCDQGDARGGVMHDRDGDDRRDGLPPYPVRADRAGDRDLARRAALPRLRSRSRRLPPPPLRRPNGALPAAGRLLSCGCLSDDTKEAAG